MNQQAVEGDWFLGDGAPRRVLVVNPLRSYWAIQMCLEAALRYHAAGHAVFWLDMPTTLGALGETAHVSEDDVWRSLLYADPSVTVKKILRTEGVTLVEPPAELRRVPQIPELPRTLEELERWKVGGFPVGKVAASGVAGRIKERYFDVSSNRSLTHTLAVVALMSQDIVRSVLVELAIDLLVTTNDRVVPSSAALLVAGDLGVDRQVVYWGSVGRILGYSPSLFDSSAWRRIVAAKWREDSLNPAIVDECAAALSVIAQEGLRHNELFDGIHAGMKSGLVPEVSGRKRCVHFAGTPWEFTAVRDWPPHYFQSEIEAVDTLSSLLPAQDWEIWIRHHPPWGEFGDKSERHAWQALNRWPHVKHIDADDPINSLELAASADLTTTWESSIGIEIIARGGAVAALGDPYWARPEWGIMARSEEQLWALLSNGLPRVKPQELHAVLNFLRDRGSEFQFVHGRDTDLHVDGAQLFQLRVPVLHPLKKWKRRR